MNHIKFTVRPIYADDLDTVASMCWENRETQFRILSKQDILGFGAWDENDICIASLHCYKVTFPEWDDTDFPGYGRARLLDWPLGWPLLATQEKKLEFSGPVWGQACFHVGILPNTWQANPDYFRKGIGTALLNASVSWAKVHEYSAIIAQGGSKIITAYNLMMGCLPWTSYAKMGFVTKALEEDGLQLPWWVDTKGEEINSQVKQASAEGQKIEDIAARLMVLFLN